MDTDELFKSVFDHFVGLALTLFRMGGAKKTPPTSFFVVTPTDVVISHQNFLTFRCNPLPHLCKISRPYLVPVPNY